ncbi:MAG: Structural maintenance of chromosomes protein 5 [Bogoriella megaspora]|nr:MAG: Structural maintenance of chromosomes protein 5 [Bogoriella megaspora]
MPGLIMPQRRSHSETLDSGESSEESASSNGSKRARLSQLIWKQIPSDGSRTNGIQSYTNGAVIIEQEHQPGSIVRVKLKNFVTYTATEFHPGPSLNMIIGPNGTGKSTLVCAICLGLGWGPQHLGRAKELSEFVKHGAREAEIEIELKAGERQRGRNPVIRRHIKREGNKTSWFINGSSSTHKAVQQLAKSFSIQVDNLCQFLPQDRVVEFAALSPVQLLDQTQRAAAPEYMVEWHDKLKGLRSQQKKSQAEQGNVQESLTNLEARQRAQQVDYDRMQEREHLKSRITALEQCRPMVQYRLHRNRSQNLKAEREEAKRDLTRLEREVEPSMRAVNDKKAYKEQVEKVVNARDRISKRHENRVNEFKKEQDVFQEKITECDTERQTEKNSHKSRHIKTAKIQNKINDLKAKIADRPPTFDAADYNNKIRAVTRDIRAVDDRAVEIRDANSTLKNQMETRERTITERGQRITQLQSQAGQQLQKLRAVSKDSEKLWRWVQENPDKFKDRIHGPPIIECSLKDDNFADVIESMFQVGDLKAFTCTSQDDFRTLQNAAYKELRLSDIHIRHQRVGVGHYKAPVLGEEMKRLGLDGWILDYVDGPEPVLAMLCENTRIHQTGLALRDLTESQFNALQSSPITSFADRSKTYQIVRRREYGDKAASTRVRDVRPARFWNNKRGDGGLEDQLKREIREARGEIEEIKQQNQSHTEEKAKLAERYKELNTEKQRLETEKETYQKLHTEYAALPARLSKEERDLAAEQNETAEYRARLEEIERRRDEHILAKGDKAIEYARAAQALRVQIAEHMTAQIILLEATADAETLIARNAQVENLLQTRRQEVQQKDQEYKATVAQAKRYLAQWENITREQPTAEQRQALDDIKDMTPEDLEVAIGGAKSGLEMLHEGNPGAIAEFEARAQKIESLKQKVASSAEVLEQLEDEIAEIKGRWEPELDQLINQISDAFGSSFEKIGCAGQVGIHKDEDFENWAVQIMVRFRENEALAQLDSHRQSGGERAVSTIFYLMALQSLARAPFRVVDEINQGMDPRNERIVHERMVDIACGAVNQGPAPNDRSQTAELYGTGDSGDEENSVLGDNRSGRQPVALAEQHTGQTSQYFLITPKLLSGLKYQPGMKVHCIASGEYMPQDWKKLDFGKMLQHAKMVVGRTRGGNGVNGMNGGRDSLGLDSRMSSVGA